MHDKVFDENQGQVVLKSHYFPSVSAIVGGAHLWADFLES